MDLRCLFLILLTMSLVNADSVDPLNDDGFKECSVGVDKCHEDYKEKVQAHTTDTKAVCRDMNALMKCIFNQGCPVEQEQQEEMKEAAHKALDKLGCSSVQGYSSSSASEVLPRNALLIAMISTIFLFIKDCMAWEIC